jgi:hypothetical protein
MKWKTQSGLVVCFLSTFLAATPANAFDFFRLCRRILGPGGSQTDTAVYLPMLPNSRARAFFRTTGLYDPVYAAEAEKFNAELETHFATATFSDLVNALFVNNIENEGSVERLKFELRTAEVAPLPFDTAADAASRLNLNPQGLTIRGNRLFVVERSRSTSGAGISDPGLRQPGIHDILAGKVPGFCAIQTGLDDYLARTNSGLGGRYPVTTSYIVFSGKPEDVNPSDEILRQRLIAKIRSALASDTYTVEQGLRNPLARNRTYEQYRSLLQQVTFEKGYRPWDQGVSNPTYLPPRGFHAWAADRNDHAFDFWLVGKLPGYQPKVERRYGMLAVEDIGEARRALQELLGPRIILERLEVQGNSEGIVLVRGQISTQ